jgi:glycosyltransferase involved in cell wall biosynthesis
MNILFICNEYPPSLRGGIGTVTQVLAKGLHARGHSAVVAGFYTDIPSKLEIDNIDGIIVYRLRQSRGLYGFFRSRILLFFLVKKIIKKHDIQILEAPDFQGLLAFWPRLSVPIIIRLHGSVTYFASELNQKANKKFFSYELNTLKKAALIIGVSSYVSEKTKCIFGLISPIKVIYNSVDVQKPFSVRMIPPENTKVIFTGTLTKKKGVFSLIEAWPEVLRQVPKAKLYLFGKDTFNENGVSIKSILMQKHSPDLQKSVNFQGYVNREQVLEELKTAAVAVLPSFTEAFALAPLEAMAQGCPTIYTKLASGPEIINDGVNGLLIDPFKPHDIAEAIIKILTDKYLAAKIGDKGRKSVEDRFSTTIILSQNEEIYKSILAR